MEPKIKTLPHDLWNPWVPIELTDSQRAAIEEMYEQIKTQESQSTMVPSFDPSGVKHPVKGLLVENETRHLDSNKILANREHALEVVLWVLEVLDEAK